MAFCNWLDKKLLNDRFYSKITNKFTKRTKNRDRFIKLTMVKCEQARNKYVYQAVHKYE